MLTHEPMPAMATGQNKQDRQLWIEHRVNILRITISYYLYLMLYACAAGFDVMENLNFFTNFFRTKQGLILSS
jgi:hypothetical protein